jgi:hypothetical protein
MSVSRVSPDEKRKQSAISKVKKKVSGATFGMPKCALCGREFSEKELLAEDFVWSVGKAGSVQFHPACFKKEFGMRSRKKEASK